MLDRRRFLREGGGLAAVAMGLGGRGRSSGSAAFAGASSGPFSGYQRGDPILPVELSASPRFIGGFPYAPNWGGDDFERDAFPFHECEDCFPGGRPPAVSEQVDVAIVGGGISGLATAYALRDRSPVLFELRPRLGGNAMGESWSGTPYTLGSAYFITPDPGTELDELYRELRLDQTYAFSPGDTFEMEWQGEVVEDACQAIACTPADLDAIERYRALVETYANESYPEIPLPGKDDRWIRELDQIPFETHIREGVGVPMPAILENAIQAYCYSSFGVGWQEISAASGWNFLAAEEFGRWVLPGGNAGLAQALWNGIRTTPRTVLGRHPDMRTGATVVRVRRHRDGRWKIDWRDSNGRFHGMLARQVVMANSKHVAKYMLPDLAKELPEKLNAIDRLQTVAYVVANVLVRRKPARRFYDIFLLGDGDFPMNGDAFSMDSRPTDVLDGAYGPPGYEADGDRPSVLTLYWPLPWHTARFSLVVGDDPFADYATRLSERLPSILDTLGLDADDVLEIRLARWGHAMPVANVGLIADGTCELMAASIDDSLHFVNQDNWALPAIENSILDAFDRARRVREAS